jgi:KDO2-lipid IV(A) lauroyltransferase
MQTILYWLVKSLVLFIQAFPLTAVAWMGRGAGQFAHLVDARHRRVVRENLRGAFPEKAEEEIREIARENFKRIGENFACAIKTASMEVEEIAARCEFVGLERVAAKEGEGHPNRIVAIGHFGNFEIYTLMTRFAPGYQGATTYRALNQPGLNRLMQELRNTSGCLYFERRTGAKDLIRALNKEGMVLGLLSDQHGGRSGLWGPFLGRDCSTNPAPAVFALRYKAPLHSGIVYTVGRGRWRLEMSEEIPTCENGEPRTVEAVTADVNRALEAAVRRDPANWFWVHRRWKPRSTSKAKLRELDV